MFPKAFSIALLFFSTVWRADAQSCNTLGQDPSSAFPVCGSKSLAQSSVPLCGHKFLVNPCRSDFITDRNPFWYKFTCYKNGTLGFEITPDELAEDYDWQMYDVTGHSTADVYTDPSLFVACNWSGEAGTTGASAGGVSLEVCEGLGQPLFSSMPVLQQGHEYLLLISHFTNTQSGYELKFVGGTADITNPNPAVMQSATGSCKGSEIGIKLSTRLQCSSLAPDGSDFYLPSGAAEIISATASACSNGFDMDSVVLVLDRTLPPADFTVATRRGNDGNTLLDECGNEMEPGITGFTVHENVSVEFDYQLARGCVEDTLTLMHPGGNGVSSWNWSFDDNTVATSRQIIKFYGTGGNKTIRLQVSNEWCSDSASTTITLEDKIRAALEAPDIICAIDKAVFTNQSTGDIRSWNWDFGDGNFSNEENPEPFQYSNPGRDKLFKVVLRVSDQSGCQDTASAMINVVSNCIIAVPSAFTPNGDGKNDRLYPSNAFNADNLVFRVFNRFGQLIFETRDWRKQWDGTVNGLPQGTGTYVWVLNYTLKATGQHYNLRGVSVLIR